MDRMAGHDTVLRDKLLAAHRHEPVVAAGSMLDAPARQYLRQAIHSALDPVAA
ncbi:hypothetical protein [Pyxidicoccus xibeiensis]|uniref:hypothetical protein n=1 Tax=Pyxidicoccus xibeiensis TaxID=2906759 RepID=UPI0020A7618B|nr:hypothetical protein [Pyxidicoccus xibeiensis]MCP3137772.1 hypothetical protein [Pyxidicoccus xibeiensis]